MIARLHPSSTIPKPAFCKNHALFRIFSAKNRSRTDERGFFTIWILGLCVMLFAMGGISLDLWRGFTDRRELAAITDAAAIAGASQLDLNAFKQDSKNPVLDPVLAQNAALQYLNTQAAESGITFTSAPVVTVENNTVSIEATTNVKFTLLKFFDPNGSFNLTTHSSSSPEEAA